MPCRLANGQLAALGSEMDALRVEESRIRSGDIKFLPGRVASLRVRQVHSRIITGITQSNFT